MGRAGLCVEEQPCGCRLHCLGFSSERTPARRCLLARQESLSCMLLSHDTAVNRSANGLHVCRTCVAINTAVHPT